MAEDDPLLDPGYRYATHRFTGNGSKVVWDLNFSGGIISREHVRAYYEDADGSLTPITFTFVTDTSINITPAVTAGRKFVVYRNTPKGAPLVDYTTGSAFTESNLDRTTRQAVFASAETLDRFADVNLVSSAALSNSALALETASNALGIADNAANTASAAADAAAGAINTANETAAGFEALGETIEDLLGADLTGLARTDTSQSFSANQQFRNGLEVANGTGTLGVKFLPNGKYQTFASGVYSAELSFGDWDTLVNKPVTFSPSSHTHAWGDITGKPTSFSPSAHTHPWSDITGAPSTYTPSAHTHGWSDITPPANLREIVLSTSAPSGGTDGLVWMRYAA